MATAGPQDPGITIDYGTKEAVTVWEITCNRCKQVIASDTTATSPDAKGVKEAVDAHVCPPGTVFDGRITED